MRITLIHALKNSVQPAVEGFERLWPEAQTTNLLDDSLSSDLVLDGRLTPEMTDRFLALARYSAKAGADGILFTCSAFGACIDACAQALAPMPILKPNEAMIGEALERAGPRGRIGLLATFSATLTSMPSEFTVAAPGITVKTALAADALALLNAGNGVGHDMAAQKASLSLSDCDVIALAQFSLARAATAVRNATERTVLTTPESAVRKLRRIFEQ
jgi:hypothetical protein